MCILNITIDEALESLSAFCETETNSWNNGDSGRKSYNIMPSVGLQSTNRIRGDVIFFSDHGPFPVYLRRFHLSDSDQCSCGETGKRGFRLRKENREAEDGKKRAALVPGRIQNFAADYLLGRAGDAGFGKERPYRLTHHLNGYAMTLD
ncbi:hypothetical protein AVEN_270068-1 [Araneus ventricosus]|uniref:Uncharacterized protein n=1 Tax=Araneus ventricosus TaxID=182803 RepID=A0A4Y2MTV6_ARAVE|nr:hypothetical protein AVEN_270068-1 [Araneus ventricosus]